MERSLFPTSKTAYLVRYRYTLRYLDIRTSHFHSFRISSPANRNVRVLLTTFHSHCKVQPYVTVAESRRVHSIVNVLSREESIISRLQSARTRPSDRPPCKFSIQIFPNIVRQIELQWKKLFPTKYHKKHYTSSTLYMSSYRAHSVRIPCNFTLCFP